MESYTETTWADFYDEAKKYNKLLKGALNKPEKFTPDFIYNIAVMSVEKYFMAYFLKKNILPPNHTIADLVMFMKQYQVIPDHLETRLLFMNDFQEICSLEQYNRKTPTKDDTVKFADTVDMVFNYIDPMVAV